jgi:hypothetical protein
MTPAAVPHVAHAPFDPQAGPFTSSQALTGGLSRWDLAQLVSHREVRRILTDVYVPWDEPDTLEHRARAVALVLPEHTVAVDRTAAWLWGVDVRRPWQLDVPPSVEFFALRGHTRVRRRQVRSGQRDLAPRDITSVGSVRVTVPLRTALDLACIRGPYEALAALDGFARVHGLSADDMHRELGRYRRRRGVVQARRLVPLVDGRAESAGESFTRLAIADSGLPVPQPQVWVLDGGVATYRLDLAFPRLKICIEYDGEAFHSTPEQREADRRRRDWLRDQGWIVIVVRKDDFKGAALDAWLRELAEAITERSRR